MILSNVIKVYLKKKEYKKNNAAKLCSFLLKFLRKNKEQYKKFYYQKKGDIEAKLLLPI